jgi:hypothetical protein
MDLSSKIAGKAKGVLLYIRLFGFRCALKATIGQLLNRPTELVLRVPGLQLPVHLRAQSSDVRVFN